MAQAPVAGFGLADFAGLSDEEILAAIPALARGSGVRTVREPAARGRVGRAGPPPGEGHWGATHPLDVV